MVGVLLVVVGRRREVTGGKPSPRIELDILGACVNLLFHLFKFSMSRIQIFIQVNFVVQ